MRYLDYAATTPLLPEVLEEMKPYMTEMFGNPSSVYAAGRDARKGIEVAREQVAAALDVDPSEIVFTSGGTEADNLAVKGAALKQRSRGDHVITTGIEHHAVLHSAEWLERQGFRVTFIPVNADGVADIDALEKSIGADTVLVSMMLVNNEIGTIQPVMEALRLVKENSKALFHVDAVQAIGKIEFSPAQSGVDLAAISAHKIGGPKGVGALYVRRNTPLDAQLHGGGQERDRRSGTSNVSGIVGLGKAAEIAASEVQKESPRLSKMRDRLQSEITQRIEGVHINGAGVERAPGILNICIERTEGESLLLMLDAKEIAASSGSACTSGSLDPSHVLLAMGVRPELAHGSLRFSLGRATTDEDIDHVLKVLPEVVGKLSSIAPKSVAGAR